MLCIFIIHLERVIDNVGNKAISVLGPKFSNMKFAILYTQSKKIKKSFKKSVNQLNEEGEQYKLTR